MEQIIIKNNLSIKNPKLAEEWHPNKNGGLTPDDVTTGSNKKIWWRCEKGHEWKAIIASRASGRGCPFCSGKQVLAGFNDLATKNSRLASEWHPSKNGDLTPEMVMPNSNKKYWWLGKCGHEWVSRIISRNSGTGCPFCSNQQVLIGFNDLATTNPKLAKEWHPNKNGDLTPEMVTNGSGKIAWWLGKCGHEWQSTINSRDNGNGCPICTGRQTLEGFNDLITINPKLAEEWHPKKNGKLSPKMITANSHKKIWWLGKCGHEWQTDIGSRSRGRGCPICRGRQVLKGYNDLLTVNPILAKEWHPTKNGNLSPNNVTMGSHLRVWWKCKYGHEWQSKICNRSAGRGCPVCVMSLKSSKPEQIIYYYIKKYLKKLKIHIELTPSWKSMFILKS